MHFYRGSESLGRGAHFVVPFLALHRCVSKAWRRRSARGQEGSANASVTFEHPITETVFDVAHNLIFPI